MTDDARQRAAETKRRRTRNKLVDAAVKLFEDGGWELARMEDVAVEAGVSVATAYNHFKTKTALIEAVCSRTYMRAEGFSSTIHGIPAMRVARYIAFVTSQLDSHPRMPPLLVALISEIERRALDPSVDPELMPYLVRPLFEIIRDGQRSGAFQSHINAYETAAYHIDSLVLRRVTQRAEPIQKAWGFVLGQLLPALTTQRQDFPDPYPWFIGLEP
ncbi:TetR/AcrR family transcriptional regulator [Streptomyces sp. MBT56]|uniref:TetR/AcrR family transcriptional regulator n=1 Tax=unclassified Streptomyces TaxID=2593676 RepID=UPI00190C8432|nr:MULTISPECIES: TetR/AcrR family transcriptional regulator [unclassified Streptomyces]MBK3559783.1 TetR/AcrR family transcriptional regulator [Streptomyces sp. MBT56]MBK3601275.1 TetR/AcrR family transcriptional regulator [Streptomyces sp. MBT54]MBK3615278.1 TetR/AcrR family transcriptional regulator [Streptomyces sp. MBT98]